MTSGLRARDVLIVGQLACAVVFICSTIVIRAQTQQMTSADLGFDKDRVLTTRYVFNDSVMLSKRDVIKEAFRRTPGVEAATTLWPGPGMEWVLRMVYPEADPTNGFEAQMLGVDEDFLETYGVRLLAGRNLFPDGVDSGAVQYILNETAVDRLGCAGPTEALGGTLRIGGQRGTVVGVVADFHYRSLREAIPPLVMRAEPRIALAIRIRGGNKKETLAAVDSTWRVFFEQPNELRFVTDMWGFGLWDEERRGQAYGLLTWTAIMLASLGVYGLAAYEVEQRRREVGVRKALGASMASIVAAFWTSHVRLVIVAILLAVPLAYWLVIGWLQGFAYRIDLTTAPFAIASGIVGALFLTVVGAQAARAASACPADTLRSE